MTSVRSVVNGAARVLRDAGIETPINDAKLMLAGACDVEPRDISMLMALNESLPNDGTSHADLTLETFRHMITRRAGHEPLQYIVGHAPFRYLDMLVGPGVFIPRPETETVVQTALDWMTDRRSKACNSCDSRKVVDLCAGSGVIGLSMVTELPDCEVWAVEQSADAIAWAQRNANVILRDHPQARDAYHLVQADATSPQTLAPLDGRVDIVISNPPYVPQSQVPEQVEVRDYDPAMALYGGSADGLLIPERIIERSSVLLRSGGALVMEHDISQSEELIHYAQKRGFTNAKTGKDLTGKPRYLFAIAE
jgi:release factor glutamine methyltransferase